MRQLNGLAVNKEEKRRMRLLLLNENDCIKITEGLKKSQTEVVPPIDNIRLFETDYTDLISYQINFIDCEQQGRSGEIFFDDGINGAVRYFYNHFVPQYAGNSGKAMNLYDICNWYSLPLGFTVTGIYTSTDQTPYANVYQNIDHILEGFYKYGPGDILSMIEKRTALVDYTGAQFMNLEILLEQSYPDSNSSPTTTSTPALIFTPEGNRFYFPNPVG